MSNSNMDTNKAKSLYIKLRVQPLKDEIKLSIAEMKKAEQDSKLGMKRIHVTPKKEKGLSWSNVIVFLIIFFAAINVYLSPNALVNAFVYDDNMQN